MLKLAFAFLLLATVPVAAQSGSHYDWRSGNQHHWNSNPYGGTTYRGNNFRTGSSWSGRIDSRGNQSGYDSRGNYWNYNRSSGRYHNFGTGKSCYGRGTARRCY